MDAPVPSWQVPQAFETATSLQVRDELSEFIARDLLGPWDGETEQLPLRSRGPRDRYLLGMLGPRRSPENVVGDAADLPDTEIGAEGDGEAELPELPSAQTIGRMWASSMGLSFQVESAVAAVRVLVEWGAYSKEESPDEEGRNQRRWTRHAFHDAFDIALDGSIERRWLVGEEGDDLGVWLQVTVRQRGTGRRVVRVVLVNGQTEDVTPKDLAWLFQTVMTVTASDGKQAIFLPVADPMDGAAAAVDPEERLLSVLYRDQLRHASGHNVAVHPDVREGERCAWRLTTTWLPSFEVPQVAATTALAGLQVSMDALAALADAPDPSELVEALMPLTTEYGGWLADQERKAESLPVELREPVAAALHRARQVAARVEAGIELLGNDPDARRSFAFANSCMALQRRNTAAAVIRADDPDVSYGSALDTVNAGGPKAASWRPFQLAFILINLPALTDPGHPERAETVDLLFFPTGGGKTEAYLGLAAYTFAIRRLQGVIGSGVAARDGRDGVAVMMRYTLRLLTAQQFQRAAALVCAAEVLRREDPATWGEQRFRIGLWVGGSVSPNWYQDAAAQIAEARDAGRGTRANVLQTLACPWCGAALKAHRDYSENDTFRRVILYCPEGEGPASCPFSRTRADGEGLPILTVDEEIYRYPPSLLIATVDKLAQLPWFGFAGILFGRVSRRCPRHGYRHPDLDKRVDCGERHNATPQLPKTSSVPVTRLRPPDLIIQDELHLISGALGTTIGLFESAVEELCAWPGPDGTLTGPKIVASTATTKRATEQVRRLYARGLAIFPPQVLDAADTFFSAQIPVSDKHPGRRYLGVCAHGVRMKQAEIRLAEILLVAGQTLFDRYGEPADPYMTLVGYFNATRELAGMRRYLDDDIATRVARNGRRKGLSNRMNVSGQLTIRELTSRINSGDIAAVLKQLEEMFDPQRHTTARRIAMLAEFKEARGAKRNPDLPGDWGRSPVDVALATSMLQVGVDVARFGLMVVTGQPKNTAEYIQASSRVGRSADRPGLVITVYNWSRPRDLAHFEDFEHYHATFYRQVEALSVTPFSRRSLDRGTAATYVAAVRNTTEEYSVNAAAFDVDLSGPVVTGVTDRMLRRAERAGDGRARDYLQDRIQVLKERWARERQATTARLGYREAKENGQQIVGLLEAAGEGPWGDLTVGRSMRETENEINLLVPATGMFAGSYDAPDWTFSPPPDAATPDDPDSDGDELGNGDSAGGVAK